MSRPKGSRLFESFLKRNNIEQLECAEALDASPASVNSWIKGVVGPDGERHFWAPRPAMQDKIETWTEGDVPASSWRTAAEQRAATSVQPFRNASGHGGG